MRSVLTDQDILTKTIYEGKVLKTEYGLTPPGESLIPVIELTAMWGEAHRTALEPFFQASAGSC